MDEMTEELRGQTESGQEETETVFLDEFPVSVATVSIVTDFGETEDEPSADWLEPLEEDGGKGGKGGVRRPRITEPNVKRGRGGWQKGRSRKVTTDDEWLDCPELGKGWKRKVVFLRTGSNVARQTMHYRSPRGYRIRSKKELTRRVRVDLTQFDFNQGIFLQDIAITKRRKSSITEEATHSSISPSSAKTKDWNMVHCPDSFATRPQITPNLLPLGVVIPSPSNKSHSSPAQLIQISPLSHQTLPSSLSPSLRLGDFSSQLFGQFTALEKGKAALLPHSWLQAPLAPVSPNEIPEKETSTHLSALSSSPDISLVLDPNISLNGGKEENGFSLNVCAKCGCEYLVTGSEEEPLCPKCSLKKRQHQPHIVFKKVGQDKWVLGKAKAEKVLKKKIPPLGDKHYTSLPDSEDDDHAPDGGDDDDIDPGLKKRKRRTCGKCKACLQETDCGKCDFCIDKPKFGGDNKKRQKCRFRQCQFHSRLQTWTVKHHKHFNLADDLEDVKVHKKSKKQPFRKPGRPKRQKGRYRPWDNFSDNEDNDDEDEELLPSRKGRQGGRRKRRYRLKEEEDAENDEMDETKIEERELDNLKEAQFMACDDGSNVYYKEIYPNIQTPRINEVITLQNGTMDIVNSSIGEPGLVESCQLPQGWVCTVPGLPEGPVKQSSNGLLPFSDILGKVAPAQVSNILSSNSQLSEALNKNWINLVQVEAAMPQIVPAPQLPPQLPPQPAPQPAPKPPDSTPVICSLMDIKEMDPSEDSGLLELLTDLRHTVLPAHWVGVMAKGPLLQLFQCSKLSPMADTVLQIETDFYYQINVQNQPLLLTHPIYERHPQRLSSISLVVALLLDLEEQSVCQGYQNFEAEPRQGPLLCARAALCQLLVPQDDECCEKCLEG